MSIKNLKAINNFNRNESQDSDKLGVLYSRQVCDFRPTAFWNGPLNHWFN